MRRCSSARETTMVGRMCSCGLYHSQTTTTPFCVLLSVSNGGRSGFQDEDDNNIMCGFNTTPSSTSSVDCTLSLGTPSTRLATPNNDINATRRSSSRVSTYFGWNILPTSSSKHPNGATDPLLARRCANCDTTSTPLWRNGPRGPKSLCNACGIRFKKEERRAAAATEKAPAGRNEFRLMNEGVGDSVLSWRFNVTDMPGLVHDFTG